jgi:drug/metabolite transporter (DMT)-like permease
MGERWSARTWLLFSLIVLAWGFNYLFVDLGLRWAGPIWLAVLRSGVGCAGMLVLVTVARGWGTLDVRARRDALLLGIPNTTLFFGLWFVAARSVPPGIASVVIYTFPFWVALLSATALGRPLSRVAWLSIGVGFAGVVLLSQAWSFVTPGLSLLPIVELLAASLSWAVGTVLFQRRFRRPEILSASFYQLAGGLAGLVILLLATGITPVPHISIDLLAASLWLGLVGTTVAYAIWFTLLGHTPAARMSAYLFLVPLVALGASVLLLGERLVAAQAAGALLVIVAIYVIGRTPVESVPGLQGPPAD